MVTGNKIKADATKSKQMAMAISAKSDIGQWQQKRATQQQAAMMAMMAKKQRGMKETPLVVLGFLKSNSRIGPEATCNGKNLRWQKLAMAKTKHLNQTSGHKRGVGSPLANGMVKDAGCGLNQTQASSRKSEDWQKLKISNGKLVRVATA